MQSRSYTAVFTAPTLSSLGIPTDEFACMFACGRMLGWCGHVLEQLKSNRLIRPQATYIRPDLHPFEPINHRQAATANGPLR